MSDTKKSDEMLVHILAKICDSSREYRIMAKEFLRKADDLEAMALKVALEVKMQDNEDMKAFVEGAAKASAKDVFENFGDMFSGKKGTAK
jgi:hypothetical protein